MINWENWIDAVICIIVGLSVVMGIWRGLYRALFGVLVLVAAFFAAKEYGHILAPGLRVLLGESPLVLLLQYGAVFLMVLLLGNVATSFTVKWLKKLDGVGLDFFGGMLFGLLRGALFSILFVLLLGTAAAQSRVWRQSTTVPYAGVALKSVMNLPVLSDYQKWVRYDKAGRPYFVATRSTSKERKRRKKRQTREAKSATKQRDDVLDEVTEELVSQTNVGHGNAADQMAKERYQKEGRKATPLQNVKDYFNYAYCELRGERRCEEKLPQ